MSALTSSSPLRHLRARDEAGSQQTTTVELFFDLVYVFAITQLSHLVLDDLSIGGVARAPTEESEGSARLTARV